MFAASYLWTLEKQLTRMHQHNWKWGSSLPALQMMGQSHFPHQFQTEVSQCPKLILISITVEEESGPFFSFRSCRSSDCQYLRATQKCESIGSYQLLICFMFHNPQWKKRSTYGTTDFTCLYTQILGHLQTITLSNTVTTTATGAECKGAMGDAKARYTCQVWLPCPGWLNVILGPCLCQLTSTSLPDALSTGAMGPSCCDISEGWHGCCPEAVAAWAAPTSHFATATCCATPSPWHYSCSWNWTGELSWVKSKLFFCLVIFNSDRFPDPGHCVAARIVMPGGNKWLEEGGTKPYCKEKLLGAFSELLSRHGVCPHAWSPPRGGRKRLCAAWWRHLDSIQGAAFCVTGLWFGKAGWQNF